MINKYRITGKMLHYYQKDFVFPIIQKQKKHLLVIAPRRSGKSVLTFWLVNALINKYYVDTKQPCNATIYAPEQKQCRAIYVDNILSDGRKLLETANARFVESRLSLEYPFKSTLKLGGSDMINSQMGAGNKIVVLDEYALSKAESFNRLYPMVHATNGHMIVVSTPRGKNHLYDLYQKVKDDPSWEIIYTDVFKLNIMTKAEYDSLPMDNNYKRQEFLCSWDSPFENAIYLEPQVKKLYYTDEATTYISIDMGIRDATAIIISQLDINGDVNIIHSYERTNMSMIKIIEELLDYCQQNNLIINKMFVPHDASNRDYFTGKSRLDYINECGIDCHLISRTGIIDGIDIVRKYWDKIYFNDNRNNISIEKIKSYTIDSTGKPKHDGSSHMADALRYLILGIDNIMNIDYNLNLKYEMIYNHNLNYRKI